MIIKRAQGNMVDVWDDTQEGWESNHTRVLLKKEGTTKKAIYIAGNKLPKIKLVQIVKSI